MAPVREIKKILVPIDFSPNSSGIVDYAVNIAEKFNAKLTIIHVVESIQSYEGFAVPHISLTQFEEGMQKNAKEKMTDFIEKNLPASITRETKVLLGDVSEEINALAKDEGMDLIIMGTHGYKKLEHLFFGSVAEKVVRTAPCPVLTMNPFK